MQDYGGFMVHFKAGQNRRMKILLIGFSSNVSIKDKDLKLYHLFMRNQFLLLTLANSTVTCRQQASSKKWVNIRKLMLILNFHIFITQIQQRETPTLCDLKVSIVQIEFLSIGRFNKFILGRFRPFGKLKLSLGGRRGRENQEQERGLYQSFKFFLLFLWSGAGTLVY